MAHLKFIHQKKNNLLIQQPQPFSSTHKKIHVQSSMTTWRQAEMSHEILCEHEMMWIFMVVIFSIFRKKSVMMLNSRQLEHDEVVHSVLSCFLYFCPQESFVEKLPLIVFSKQTSEKLHFFDHRV